jgi:hypothetical protein
MHFSRLFRFVSFLHLFKPILAHLEPTNLHNANHLFNAIHSSMRQWGESLNHNGMSFFLATVPAGTQLYHGTGKDSAIQGMEWLAFEPEHSRIFAQPRTRPPQDKGEGPHNYEEHLSEIYHIQYSSTNDQDYQRSNSEQQQPLGSPRSQPQPGVGYIHTYIPKHDLRLLYIDGISAGKTSNGTLDTQDLLILNSTLDTGTMIGEFTRARGMCNLTSTIWKERIDGILRMEGGFEVILCDFEKHVELIDVMGVMQHRGQQGFLGGWSYIKAITSRYHGIGGDRVKLDYDNFISVFAYPGIDGLFDNDVESDYAMPRLQNVKVTDLMRVRSDLTSMILRDDGRATRNWQAVADVVVTRYSKPLHYLHTGKQIRLDKEAFKEYLELLLSPFIDNTTRNSTLEAKRCVAQVVPAQFATSLAYQTINAITFRICNTLFEAFAAIASNQAESSPTSDNAAHAIELIDDLYEYLQWTTWKECGTCPDEQVCYIPIWPMGNHEDHKHPRCRTENEARARWGYWRFLPASPPPDKGEDTARFDRDLS